MRIVETTLSVRSNCSTSFSAHFVPERCRSLQMQSIREAAYTLLRLLLYHMELRRVEHLSFRHFIFRKRDPLFFAARDVFFSFQSSFAGLSTQFCALALFSTSGAVALTFSALLNFERVLCTHTKDFICKAFQESAQRVCVRRVRERKGISYFPTLLKCFWSCYFCFPPSCLCCLCTLPTQFGDFDSLPLSLTSPRTTPETIALTKTN
jgi:hypothetical protein